MIHKEAVLMTLYLDDEEREGDSDMRGLHTCTYIHAYLYKSMDTNTDRILSQPFLYIDI